MEGGQRLVFVQRASEDLIYKSSSVMATQDTDSVRFANDTQNSQLRNNRCARILPLCSFKCSFSITINQPSRFDLHICKTARRLPYVKSVPHGIVDTADHVPRTAAQGCKF